MCKNIIIIYKKLLIFNLKISFSQLAQKEQQHLDWINQLLHGSIPNINQHNMHNSIIYVRPIKYLNSIHLI